MFLIITSVEIYYYWIVIKFASSFRIAINVPRIEKARGSLEGLIRTGVYVLLEQRLNLTTLFLYFHYNSNFLLNLLYLKVIHLRFFLDISFLTFLPKLLYFVEK